MSDQGEVYAVTIIEEYGLPDVSLFATRSSADAFAADNARPFLVGESVRGLSDTAVLALFDRTIHNTQIAVTAARVMDDLSEAIP